LAKSDYTVSSQKEILQSPDVSLHLVNIVLPFQIVLSKTGRPNFNKEEVASVEKDKRELATIVADIADHLPKEDPSKGEANHQCSRYSGPSTQGGS
jgi:hypothetical protein